MSRFARWKRDSPLLHAQLGAKELRFFHLPELRDEVLPQRVPEPLHVEAEAAHEHRGILSMRDPARQRPEAMTFETGIKVGSHQ